MEAGWQSRGNRVYFPPFVLPSGPKKSERSKSVSKGHLSVAEAGWRSRMEPRLNAAC